MALTLADLLAREREDVIRRWREKLTVGVASPSEPPSEIIDTLPLFLDQLIEALRSAGAHATNEEEALTDHFARSETARSHGAQRFRVGFSLDAVVREYDILGEAILDLVEDLRLSCSIAEFRLLSRCLGRGLAEAVAQYTHDRDAEIARASAEQFAFVAHELRNPLNAAIAAVGLLQPRITDDRATKLLSTIHRNHRRLIELIDRVLVDVRLRAMGEGMALQVARVPLAEVLEPTAGDVAPEAEEKGIRLQIEADDWSSPIEVDPRLIRSAIANLVLNAVKFTRPNGTVVIRVRTYAGRLIVEVEDECGGLPPGTLERLFTPHVQANQNRAGFGLGLAIARQAINAHGGVIQARNLAPKGCVFMLDLPLVRP